MGNIFLLIFNNTHEAITAEAKLKELSIPNKVMPTPTGIARSCGISLRVMKESLEEIIILIDQGQLKIKNIYYKVEDKYECLLI